MFSMKKKNIQGSINTLDVILKSEKKMFHFFLDKYVIFSVCDDFANYSIYFGPNISSGRTHSLNCSSVKYPNLMADSLRVVPSL